jgi:hypothetical protein
MAEIEQLFTALKRADEMGNEEDAKRIAQMIQKRKASEPAVPQDEEPGGLMPFINRAIARAVEIPIQFLTTTSRLQGRRAPSVEETREMVEAGFSAIGAPIPQDEPERMAEYIGQGLGETALLLAPTYGGLRTLSTAPGAVGRVSREMVDFFNKSPIVSTAGELTSGAMAGIGRGIAEEQEMGPTAAMLTELTFGMSPSAMALAPSRLLYGKAKELGMKAFIPFTEAGGYERASRKLRELSPDAEAASQAIREFAGEGMTPAAASGQQGLLDLEDAVLRSDPARRQAMSESTQDNVNRLEQSIVGEGDITSVRKFIDNRVERAKAAIDARIESAADDAAIALNQLGDVSAEEASDYVVASLRSALDDARAEEQRLWNRIPSATKVPVSNTQETYRSLRRELSKAQRDDMPDVARNVIGGAPKGVKFTNVKEMDGLYKALGEEAARARANKEFNKARIAEKLREAIWEDMGNAVGDDTIQETVATARAFSRELNEKFTRGPVGRILGVSRDGLARVDPSMALQSTIGVRGQAGEVSRRAIAKALDDDPTAMEGVQNYLKAIFVRNTVVDGVVDPARARGFLDKYREILDTMPGLRSQLEVARDSSDVLRRVTKRGDHMRRAIDKPGVATASRFANENIRKSISSALAGDNPVQSMDNLVRMLRKDKSGEALEGLRSAVGEWLFLSAGNSGMGLPNGAAMRKILTDPIKSKALQKVFSKEQMNRILRMNEVIIRLNKQVATKGKASISIQDKPAWLLEKIAQFGGARIGGMLARGSGYGSIQIPAIGSAAARDLLKNMTADKSVAILTEAIENKELFDALLRHRPQNKSRAFANANRRSESYLRAWMVGPGARFITADEEE